MTELTNMQLIAKFGEKISKMCKSIGEVEQDGTNTNSNYKYISSDNLVGQIRTNLSVNKLAIFPELGEIEEKSTTAQNKAGKTVYWTKTTVKMRFEIVDTETGYVKIFNWTGSDQDTGGKSLGQAITECTKRFYFKLFQVSSKEDKDPDSNTGNMPTEDSPAPAKPESEKLKDALKPKAEPKDGTAGTVQAAEPEASLWALKLARLVDSPDYKPAIQFLLKSEEFAPEDMRTDVEENAIIVYEAIIRQKKEMEPKEPAAPTPENIESFFNEA